MPKLSKARTSTSLSPESTQEGTLPPFENAKAYAFEHVIRQMEKHMEKSARVLLGKDKGEFIAEHLMLKGGGNPMRQAVFQSIKRCKEPGWYPGKVHGARTGRPAAISQHQKEQVAQALMAAKKRLQRPTPEVARAKRPRLCINKATGKSMSDWSIYNIMHSMCYDETEDDPWIYAYSPSKDYLSEGMKTHRAKCSDHYLAEFNAVAWTSHVSIDPCISVLPDTKAMSDDQKVAAMGVKKMMSKGARYKGPNCRAPITVKKEFATRDGGGLHMLAQGMRGRFERMKELQGERLRT